MTAFAIALGSTSAIPGQRGGGHHGGTGHAVPASTKGSGSKHASSSGKYQDGHGSLHKGGASTRTQRPATTTGNANEFHKPYLGPRSPEPSERSSCVGPPGRRKLGNG
jgi:hypothetical protein